MSTSSTPWNRGGERIPPVRTGQVLEYRRPVVPTRLSLARKRLVPEDVDVDVGIAVSAAAGDRAADTIAPS